jgi:hypothetical protein
MLSFAHMHPAYHPLAAALVSAALFPFVVIAALATVVVTGFALWYSARNGQKGWFIALVIFHGLGFFIGGAYLLWFRGDKRSRRHATHHSSEA